MISIKHLNKYYNKGRQNQIHVIDDVSLELPERGMVAIFGRSGCGKTTLLNVIGGLDNFAGGEVSVCGENISKNTDNIRNRNIGYIFQNYNLNKSETVLENVADALRLCGLTDKTDIDARALIALKNVGMDSFRNRLPDNLSGGQQQRVAIARAIVKNPKIILADEPTGNLDEANTVMVMDLLRQIADDHLVVLVTHEENLVDYYCDTVICVSDGKITDIRNNTITNGYVTRDKNDIYLGELEKTQLSDDHAEIQYFGDAPSEPIKLRIVNNGGRMYVKIDTPSVSVIDSGSEIKLREGVFKSEERKNDISSHIDMSALPPADGGKYGKLFDFKKSFSAGLNINFRRNRFGKRLLKFCMGMFAAVLVFMTAIFGTGIGRLIDAKDTYNHNTFYIYTDSEIYEKLNEAYENRQHGIDYLSGQRDVSVSDVTFYVNSGSFETFNAGTINTITVNAVILGQELADGRALLAGKIHGIKENEVIITDKVADMIIDNATVGYIREYGDLIGLGLYDGYGKSINVMRVAGVVSSPENAVFMNEMLIAERVTDNCVIPAEKLGIDVPEGAVVRLFPNQYLGVSDLKLDNEIRIGYKKLSVDKNYIYQRSYLTWLQENGKKVISEGEFFEDKIIADHPEDREMIKHRMEGVDFDAKYYEFIDLFNEYWAEAVDKYAFDYLDALYAYLDEYIESQKVFRTFVYEIWAALEKQDYTDLYIQNHSWGSYYVFAKQYKAANGVYPSLSMCEGMDIIQVYDNKNVGDYLYDTSDSTYQRRYYGEFIQSRPFAFTYSDAFYAVNERDYLGFARMSGTVYDDLSSLYENDGAVDYYKAVTYGTDNDVLRYSTVHSNDVAATREFLESLAADIDSELFNYDSWYQKLITPDMIYAGNLSNDRAEIISNLLAIVCVLAVMCLCMYFIMRSSTMTRVREVGIYRAIGVTKKNIIFRFMIESLILTTLTVFVGFLISSAVIYLWMGYSPSMEQFLFYPPWISAVLLAVIYAVCTLCGILPVRMLLSKSPSQIIAKYDI